MRAPLLPCLLVALLPLPALAQDGPRGIAFVQAPEQSSGVALGRTPDEAFAAATAQCVEGGALAEDCLRTNWCYPAGFSIDIFAQHREGPHWHEVICGLPSREAGEQVAHALCDTAARPYLIECALVQVYDPDGTALLSY
ncbi:hypothetical protein [Pararhodobacter sp.]|uniref:hypothetical protein n=1 Tax=Pararhodobacter sp. TaxID=2127056 RepID=UPI002FDF7013